MNINLSKKAKIIIGVVVGVLVVAGIVGASIAIANGVKKNKQAKCEHVYGEGEITAEATCEEAGAIMYTCGECKYVLTEEIPANGHVNTVIEAVPATCTKKGLTDGVKCVTCEKVLVSPVDTPMLGHNVKALKAVAATCTTAGKTEGSMCTRCNEVLKEQTVIPAKGHTVVEMKGFAATCTEEGKTNGSKCTDCGKVFSEQEVIPALGHNVVEGICTGCGAAYDTPYVSYTEKAIESNTVASGNVFRIHKDVNYSMVDGNFLSIKASFSCKIEDGAMEDYTASNIYIGVLYDGTFVASFEPTDGGLGEVVLTAENTTIEYYETDDYYDVVIKAGDTITFDGAFLYGGEAKGTFTFNSANLVGNFAGTYLLENS